MDRRLPQAGDGEYSKYFDVGSVPASKQNEALVYLWARSRIADLSDFKAEGRNGAVERARAAGKLLADRAKAVGVDSVVFDRGGYQYHGRVKAFAEGAREGGLKF